MLGVELVPYALNAIGLRGHFRMSFVCEKDCQCRKLIRQRHRKATETRLVHKDLRRLFPTMTCTLPDFLANRFLRWVDERVCNTAKVGANNLVAS